LNPGERLRKQVRERGPVKIVLLRADRDKRQAQFQWWRNDLVQALVARLGGREEGRSLVDAPEVAETHVVRRGVVSAAHEQGDGGPHLDALAVPLRGEDARVRLPLRRQLAGPARIAVER